MEKWQVLISQAKAAGFHQDNKAYFRAVRDAVGIIGHGAMVNAWAIGQANAESGILCTCPACESEREELDAKWLDNYLDRQLDRQGDQSAY